MGFEALELLQQIGGDTPDPVGQALATAQWQSAVEDARAEKETAARRAAHEERAEHLAVVDRQMGGAMDQVRRHQGEMSGLQERVDDLEAQLVKARAKRDSCRASLQWWSERLMLADESVSRSAALDPLELASARAADELRRVRESRMVLERARRNVRQRSAG